MVNKNQEEEIDSKLKFKEKNPLKKLKESKSKTEVTEDTELPTRCPEKENTWSTLPSMEDTLRDLLGDKTFKQFDTNECRISLKNSVFFDVLKRITISRNRPSIIASMWSSNEIFWWNLGDSMWCPDGWMEFLLRGRDRCNGIIQLENQVDNFIAETKSERWAWSFVESGNPCFIVEILLNQPKMTWLSNNMLYPKEDRVNRKLLYACRNCGHQEGAENACIYRNEVLRTTE